MILSDCSRPIISILMPVYNAEQFLERTITSLLDQSFENWECICVDDGSTDTSLDILHNFASQDTRISVYTQSNSGSAGKPRNKALDMAQGTFIFELDADDRITPKLLQTVYERAIDTNADYVLPILASYFPESDTIKPELTGFLGDTTSIITGREAFDASILWKISGFGLLKTEIARSERYIETNLYGDELATRRRFLRCKTVAFSTETYLYTQHSQSVTKLISPKRFEIYLNNNEILSILCEQKFTQKEISAYADQFSKMLVQGTILFRTVQAQFSKEQILTVTEILKSSRFILFSHYRNKISVGTVWLIISAIILSPFFPIKLLVSLKNLRKTNAK